MFVEVEAEHVERLALDRGRALLAFLGRGRLAGVLAGHLGDAVRDVIHHVEAADVLAVQEINRVRFLLAVDGDQRVRAGDFFLAHALHVQHRALDHALEADGGLGVDLAVGRQARHLFVEVGGQVAAQVLDVAAAGAQHAAGGDVVEQRQQQMLHGNELVALLARTLKGAVERKFKFL